MILTVARLRAARFEYLALFWTVRAIAVATPEDCFTDIELSIVVIYVQNGVQ